MHVKLHFLYSCQVHAQCTNLHQETSIVQTDSLSASLSPVRRSLKVTLQSGGQRSIGAFSNVSSPASGNLVVMAAAHAPKSPRFTHLQHHTCLIVAYKSMIDRQWCEQHDRPVCCLHSCNSNPDDKSALRQLRFTDKQAAHSLSYLSSQKRNVNIENIRRWLELLRMCDVKRSNEVLSTHPILLSNLADNSADNAGVVVQWIASMGLTSSETAQLLGRRPMLLTIPLANALEVTAWLTRELGWNGDRISRVLIQFPQLFGLNPRDNLTPKLSWWMEQGFSRETLSRVFLTYTPLFSSSIQRNIFQMSALQTFGLPRSQVSNMVQQAPALLNLNINGQNVQAKVRFLIEVMGKKVDDMCVCPNFLTFSLFHTIGPRWSFHNRHCLSSRPFNLGTKLKCSDKHFAEHMASPSLDAESISRSMTCLQLYEEHRIQWQQSEGMLGSRRASVLSNLKRGRRTSQRRSLCLMTHQRQITRVSSIQVRLFT